MRRKERRKGRRTEEGRERGEGREQEGKGNGREGKGKGRRKGKKKEIHHFLTPSSSVPDFLNT